MPSGYITLGCVLVTVLVIASVDAKPKVKPANSYFNICGRSNQKALNACVKKAIGDAAPLLKTGIPGLGLIPLEPLVIEKMELIQGEGTFSLRTILSNFTIHGLSAYTVTSANMVFDKDNKITFDLAMTVPTLKMTADYKMDGRILVIPLSGEGDCTMDFEDVVTIAHTRGRIVKRGGREFVEVQNIKWDIMINGPSKIWFYNLFNGDKRLGDATNKFLNDNKQDAFQAIKHLPEEAFGQLFKQLSSRVYDQYSVDELFLD